MPPVEFDLNGRPVAVDVPPTTTLLRLLRDHLGLTGTKEGCAEGDCGACTVAWVDDGHWRAVDACLVFAPQVHGRRVRTVEGLRTGTALHPVQQAFVDARASQCGFCTPGFVMAAFDASHRPVDDLDDAVAGNLCRCTGYRSIQDAVRAVAGSNPPDGLSPTPAPVLPFRSAAWIQPDGLDDLLRARADHPEALLVAGATDVALRVTRRHEDLPTVIATDAVEALRGVAHDAQGWTIGAGTRLTDLLDVDHPALRAMLKVFGSRQIRSRATVGGNLGTASPIGDLAPVLVASNASVTVASIRGRRSLAVEAFFAGYRRTALAPDEIVLAVHLPRPDDGEWVGAWKISRRRDMDISAVALGASVLRDGEGVVTRARLAWGGVSARAGHRSAAVEAALLGRPLDEDAVARAVAAWDFQPLSDVRGSADYRRLAAAGLLGALVRDSA